jgi:formate--tetrahydrofolate ligase
MTIPNDLEIVRNNTILHIKDIAARLGVSNDLLEYYGKHKAKLPLSLIDENKLAKHHLILVTAITPTPAGEGKTTMSIALADGMNALHRKTIAVLREPSLGPVFGIKGGGAGGGYAQVIPMEDINLHFTGDFPAIEKANNLLSAIIDNVLHFNKNHLDIDPRTITWKRVMDMNDRALRHIVIGLGGASNGFPREDGFNITPASEIMAILCLSENFADLKRRLGNIYIGSTYSKKPIFARDLNIVDAMALLLKDAIKPNLVQTLEGNPAILHGGPFASIAQGTNSVIATKVGLSLAEFVVTEAGFAADLGAEKFLNIKCVSSGLRPSAAVIVCTVRALRHHGGAKKDMLNIPDTNKVNNGLPNLEKHIENILKFGLHPVVAINSFPEDSEAEVALIQEKCAALGIKAIVSTGYRDGGGKGSLQLAEEVVRIAENRLSDFHPLYDWEEDIIQKVNKIAKEIYGADSVNYSHKAKSQLKRIKADGFDKMPICMVKTPKSLSDDEFKLARPIGFEVTVREFEINSGAGFIIPLLGDTVRMPGLPLLPTAENMKVDDNGNITKMA